MNFENPQNTNNHKQYFSNLHETYFPFYHHQYQQQQGVITSTDQPPAMDPAEQRRYQEELLKMKAIQSVETQKQPMDWHHLYWQHQQQANQIMQNPQQILNPQPATDFQSNKPENRHTSTCMVAAADLPAVDQWAWRKYGQKPIKGFSYPRSYYKCSTSKGCNAKKQVEKIMVDPDVYMVTYKGEHVHLNPVQPILLPGSVLASIIGNNPFSFDLPPQPLPPPPPQEIVPEAAMEVAEKVDEEELLIPNLMMVDQDMLTSMEELKKYYKISNDLGDGSSSSFGFGSGSGFN